MRQSIVVMAVVLLAGCGGEDGGFVSASDDEALDSNDPPTNPDPLEADQCGSYATLSPKGLTFVLHVSKNADNAAREVNHLLEVKSFIRPRDVFMIEHGSPATAQLRQAFPCNRFHYIAFPNEMKAALATGDGIDGIAVDWEGGAVSSHKLSWNVGQLHDFTHDIHAHGKKAGFVPFWPFQTEDGAAMNASNMDYAIAQIQYACVDGPEAFGMAAHKIAAPFHPVRNLGVEISLDSYASAANHVSAERASKCTRKAYGKGARAIYIYGNGHDHLPDYFHELNKLGVRSPR